MRYLLLFFLCFYGITPVFAQVAPADSATLHAIFFADTQLKGFGGGIESAYQLMQSETETITRHTSLRLKVHHFVGERFRKEALLTFLNTFTVAPNDVILFYYAGEGFRYEDQRNPWPNLYLNQGNWTETPQLTHYGMALPLLYQKLKQKQPRLLVCLADAGHSVEFRQKPTSFQDEWRFAMVEQPAARTHQSLTKQYQYLYEKSRGSVLLAGCSNGQLAEFDPHPLRGSALSWAFLNASQSTYERISWNVLLQKTQQLTRGFFIGNTHVQTPLFLVETSEGVLQAPQAIPNALADQNNQPPKIWGVFVGISNYANPSPSLEKLHYTDDDAYLLYSFYKSPAGGALPDEQLTVLVDENATKEAIIASIYQTVEKASPQDIILFYYSGHGAEGAILPYDYYPEKSQTQLSYNKIKELMNRAKARKKMIIADACYAGTLVANRGASEALHSFYEKLTKAKDGTILLASSRPREFSKEYDGLRQGVFSYFMMQALKGKSDVNEDGIVTVNELFSYVRQQVQRRTDGEQNPMMYGQFDPETPLANVRTHSTDTPLKVWAVIVGVSAYQTFSGLNYADDDAYQLYAFFKSPQGGALPDEQISILVDQNAYRDNIVQALQKQLKRAGPNDLVIFYFAGHASDQAFYPYDYNGTENRLTYETVKAFFNETRANKKLWIADACHSGGIKGTPLEAWQQTIAKQKGTVLLMSSRKEQKSYERNDLRQGIFSYYLIKGLKGHMPSVTQKAANPDCDFTCKFITLAELAEYVQRNVERETNHTQRPDISGDYNPDMPVGWVGVPRSR